MGYWSNMAITGGGWPGCRSPPCSPRKIDKGAIMNFGKYKGLSFQHIAKHNKHYAKWLCALDVIPSHSNYQQVTDFKQYCKENNIFKQ